MKLSISHALKNVQSDISKIWILLIVINVMKDVLIATQKLGTIVLTAYLISIGITQILVVKLFAQISGGLIQLNTV